MRGGEVGPDQCVTGIEAPGGAVQAVAALGHGQREAADGGRVNGGEQGGRIVGGEHGAGEGADQSGAVAGIAAFDDGVEVVLGLECRDQVAVARHQTGADNALFESVGAPRHQVVQVKRHVGAVKVAGAEMDDAGTECGRVVRGWSDRRRQVGQGGAAEGADHTTTVVTSA